MNTLKSIKFHHSLTGNKVPQIEGSIKTSWRYVKKLLLQIVTLSASKEQFFTIAVW